MGKMNQLSTTLFLTLLYLHTLYSSAQLLAPDDDGFTGFTCNRTGTDNTSYPCQTYVFYRATAPDFLDLWNISDLFSVTPLMISSLSNISSPSSPLIPNQPLFIPITCSCNTVNSTTNVALSYANLNYTIGEDDTFYIVSTYSFQNLTTPESVEVVNPTLVPTRLHNGQVAVFPIFCKCPDHGMLISYVFQPGDTIPRIARMFGSTSQAIIDVNGRTDIEPFKTIFIPVSQLPNLTQPVPTTNTSSVTPDATRSKARTDIGLWIGLGVSGFLLILVSVVWGYRENMWRKRGGVVKMVSSNSSTEKPGFIMKRDTKKEEVSLMAGASDCLDKYRVFQIEELVGATDGFDERWLIQGSVYKACIDDQFYAIKKMKWNAYEELKILQKVNHGNLVKLEGFCVESKEATCYLVYEYLENGSLYSWLHENKKEKLNWKERLRVAVDVANGLQYIHKHMRPKVVHKDIKSSNILLDSNMRAKIANFGLAKSGCNVITMHIVGTQGYIAPEYLADGVVSTKMDVFSFGVVLLELISGKEASGEGEAGELLWAKADRIFRGKLEDKANSMRLLKDYFMDEVLVKELCSSMELESLMNAMTVAIACLDKDPSRRPSMAEIVYALSRTDDYLFFDVSV